MISKINYNNSVTRNLTDIAEYSSDYTYFTGTGVDPTMAQANLLRLAPKFPYNVREVYGPNAEMEVQNYLLGLLAGLFQAVTLIENGASTKDLTTGVKANVIDKFAQYLESVNIDWKKEVVASIFTNIWTAWLEQAQARKNKDEAAFSLADSKCMENILTFADAYLAGVYKQYSPVFF